MADRRDALQRRRILRQADPGSCGSGITLIARNARLSDVLEKLAQSLGFELRFEARADSVVKLSASMPAPALTPPGEEEEVAKLK